MCTRSSITMPSLVGLRFHPPPGGPKTLSFCLFVCLSVTLLNVRVCVSDFAMKVLEYRNNSDTRFAVVHPCSTFSDCCQLATPVETSKSKIWQKLFFLPPEGDRINRSRQNLARKHIPWVCYSTPNLTLIGKKRLVQEPQKVKICPKLRFLPIGSRHNEPIQMKFGG